MPSPVQCADHSDEAIIRLGKFECCIAFRRPRISHGPLAAIVFCEARDCVSAVIPWQNSIVATGLVVLTAGIESNWTRVSDNKRAVFTTTYYSAGRFAEWRYMELTVKFGRWFPRPRISYCPTA